jgi:peptidoglycan-N-acetylglucosamine deacetylase
MDTPRLSVAITVDHDAISDSVRRGDPPVKLSHAEFGPRVGAKRLLELFARRGIATTWFVPGHSLTTFTDDTEAIVDGGHELACHGWFHEDFAELTAGEATDILGRSIEAVRTVTGAAPAGFRAPYWSLGSETVRLVEAAGFRYDSSLMADDYRPYRIRRGDRHSTTDGTTWGEPGELVEIPVYWAMDDWPHFEPGPGRSGLSAPSAVLEIWTEELRYASEHVERGLVMVTVHPECIGRGHRMAMLERFVDAAAAIEGVAFQRLDAVVARWVAANPWPVAGNP